MGTTLPDFKQHSTDSKDGALLSSFQLSLSSTAEMKESMATLL